jgi:hypothetical protein
MTTREEIIAYLDSVAPLYPGGVPPADLPAQSSGRPLSKGTSPRIIFVSDTDLTDPDRELLVAAATKGLKLASHQFECIVAKSLAEFEAIFATRTPAAVVILGQGKNWSGSVGSVGEYRGARLIRVHSAAEIRADVNKKRLFWTELKSIEVLL